MTYTCNWGLTCVSIINATCQLMNILVLSGTTSICLPRARAVLGTRQFALRGAGGEESSLPDVVGTTVERTGECP